MYCFFDDSGKESNSSSKVVSVAGYLASDNQFWTVFNAMWRQELLRHGISWLHMKDFMANQDEYAAFAWDWPKKREIIEGFIKAIRASQLVGFGVAVDAAAWRKVPKAIIKAEGDAQQFCFMRIMRMLVDRMSIAAPNDSLTITFDCDVNFVPSRFQKFIGIRNHDLKAKQYLQSFEIAEPRRYLPLQAADLLAWETRKELERGMDGHPQRPEYASFFADVIGIFPEYTGEYWSEAEIQEKIVKPFLATGQYGA